MTADDKETGDHTCIVYTYDITSDIMWSPGMLQSGDKPHLWAYNKTSQIMITVQGFEICTIKIFKAGSTLTEVESFPLKYWGESIKISSSLT